jgi:hypothetical protein
VKFYRPAIEGSWPTGEEQSRMQARFEMASQLVCLLCRRRVHASAGEALEPKLVSLAYDRRLEIQVDVVAISGKVPQNLFQLANPSSE